MSLASRLTERVRIDQLVLVDDGYGGKTASWTTLANVFAEVEPIFVRGQERLVADQVHAQASYRVRIRMRTDMTADMRLVWKTHILLIHSLHEQENILSILAYEERV